MIPTTETDVSSALNVETDFVVWPWNIPESYLGYKTYLSYREIMTEYTAFFGLI